MMENQFEIIFPGLTSVRKIDVGYYPDGMPYVKGVPRLGESNAILVARVSSLRDLMTALFIADAYNDSYSNQLSLRLPYVPGARQDRLDWINGEGDFLLAAKYVAREINARNFKAVEIFDPHSDVIAGLIDRVVVRYLGYGSLDMLRQHDAIIAPDAGAVKRAGLVAEMRDLPLVTATKTRDFNTGKLSGFSVDVEAGKRYLVVDDICDGGGTFVGLGEKIKEQGAQADLYVSHGLFTKGLDVLRDSYGFVLTTDSLVPPVPMYSYGSNTYVSEDKFLWVKKLFS